MSKKEKLLERFLSKPKDFTYDELKTLLNRLGYAEDTGGDGSRVAFTNENDSVIRVHKPHPSNIIKPYILNAVFDSLQKEGLL